MADNKQQPQVALMDPKTIGSELQKMRPQIEAALPSHIKPDRMARIALTALGATHPGLAAGTERSSPLDYIRSFMMESAAHIFKQNNGDVTKAYYAEMNAKGPLGQLAVALFRAQKRSTAAKSYRGGGFRGAAYDVKNWSLSEICRILTSFDSAVFVPSHGITFSWGWQHDPNTPGFEWVLYIELPTGQCSFHSASRLTGPDFKGKWDGVRGGSVTSILAFCRLDWKWRMMARYRKIPLTQGQVAIVDADNFAWLNQWNWFAHRGRGRDLFYAVRNAVVNGKRTVISMHRVILGLDPGDPRKGDHKNTIKTLVNTRANLRITDNRGQQHNKRKYRNNSSGFKGIYFHRSHNKYMARIAIDGGGSKFLGYRDTAEAAHRELYVPASLQLHGEFSRTE